MQQLSHPQCAWFRHAYDISETGTFNPESDWVGHPKNKTEEGFEDCRRVIAELAQIAYYLKRLAAWPFVHQSSSRG